MVTILITLSDAMSHNCNPTRMKNDGMAMTKNVVRKNLISNTIERRRNLNVVSGCARASFVLCEIASCACSTGLDDLKLSVTELI
jgi:hypothetical protein